MGQGDGGLGAELHVEENDKDGQENEVNGSEEWDPKAFLVSSPCRSSWMGFLGYSCLRFGWRWNGLFCMNTLAIVASFSLISIGIPAALIMQIVGDCLKQRLALA